MIMKDLEKVEIIKELREKILVMEGFKSTSIDSESTDFGLNEMASAFPFRTFPTGAVHELISPSAACATATNGFVSGLLSTLMKNNTSCLWISTKRSLFPLGLAYFGIEPDRVIFVDVRTDKEALWVMEQALKCNALAAVIAELGGEITFAQSQRLQLAVEESKVTGFLHRKRPGRENTLACVSRWKVRPAASLVDDGLPGVGLPIWDVQLEKIQNGKPGTWQFGWKDGFFIPIQPHTKASTATTKIERYA